jgi:hypothetical protein
MAQRRWSLGKKETPFNSTGCAKILETFKKLETITPIITETRKKYFFIRISSFPLLLLVSQHCDDLKSLISPFVKTCFLKNIQYIVMKWSPSYSNISVLSMFLKIL